MAVPEATKRQQTLSVLERLRAEGAPRSAKYQDQWSGEPAPAGEDQQQTEFDQDLDLRRKQELLNKGGQPVTGAMQGVEYGRRALGMEPEVMPGPTGVSPEAVTPYSAEYADKRRSVSELPKPGARRPKKKALVENNDKPDDSASVVGGY